MAVLSSGELPGFAALRRQAAAEFPQKDDLCGPFWAVVVLRVLGFEVSDQDVAAVAAGTLLSNAPDRYRPAGAPARADYRLPLPHAAADDHDAGTSARGVGRAIAALSGGGVRAVPLRADAGWSPELVLSALRLAARVDALVVANIATEQLADPRDPAAASYPETGDAASLRPLGWRVGHFVALGGWVTGPLGSSILILDTSEALAPHGLLSQPAPLVAAALDRPGRGPGGLLLVTREATADALVAAARELGLRPGFWD